MMQTELPRHYMDGNRSQASLFVELAVQSMVLQDTKAPLPERQIGLAAPIRIPGRHRTRLIQSELPVARTRAHLALLIQLSGQCNQGRKAAGVQRPKNAEVEAPLRRFRREPA